MKNPSIPRLYHRLRIRLGFPCTHDLELQRTPKITEYYDTGDLFHVPIQNYEHALPHTCQLCGKRGAVYGGRFIPSI